MVCIQSFLTRRKICISCDSCTYQFEFDYEDLKTDECLVFCPICYNEKVISPKEEITSFLRENLEQLNMML